LLAVFEKPSFFLENPQCSDFSGVFYSYSRFLQWCKLKFKHQTYVITKLKK